MKSDNGSRCGSASCMGLVYDILAQIISVLDVTTDIIVCIQYYEKDRMIFFWISLTILLLALFAYDITFMINFSNENKIQRKICLFLIMLPLSPFIPYLLYFTADPKSKIALFLKNDICCFKIYLEDRASTSQNVSKLRQFMESKIMKHLGFIVEALVEAFPQSILQMTAIVIYKEANVIAIISILISMLSVASKSFVFSIATALTLKQLFFNWLSAINDFFGLFFVVTWVFYQPKDEYLKDAFIVIQNVWLYRIYICTLPLIGTLAIFGYAVFYDEFSPSTHSLSRMSNFGKWCSRIFTGFVIFIMTICGIVAGTLMFEILTWVWPAGTMWILGTDRFPESKEASEFYFSIINWINSAKKHHVGSRYQGCTSYTKQQDKMMRISSFHSVMLTEERQHLNNDLWYLDAEYFVDKKCEKYLKREIERQYMNVTMEGLRVNTSDHKQSEFLLLFWTFYGQIWRDVWSNLQSERAMQHVGCKRFCISILDVGIVGIITFICGPIYLLSRIWSLFFPLWIVGFLYFGHGVNVWNTSHIDLFQVVMITIYMALCFIIWILFYMNCYEQYLMHHLMPSKSYLPSDIKSSDSDRILKNISNHYYGIVVIPIRRAIVIDHFGPDLGPIILSYLPVKDEYESSDHVVRVKTV